MLHAVGLACMMAAVLFGVCPSEVAQAEGIMKLKDGFYLDELEDVTSLDLVQALVVNAADTSIGVSNTWTLAQPSVPAGVTNANATLFSSGGTNSFTSIASIGSQNEEVNLLQRWYSAAKDMEWQDECKAGVPGTYGCYVYPVSAYPLESAKGARSARVIHVPNVYTLSNCAPATGGCAADKKMIKYYALQQYVQDILAAGKRCNATWFVRSPSPSLSEKKFALFEIVFSYSVTGMAARVYKGGTAPDSSCSDLGCASPESPSGNCPVDLYSNTVTLAPDLYLGDVYTPISFSFCIGSRAGEDANAGPLCKSCSAEDGGDPTQDICRVPPGGIWEFNIGTKGGTGNSCGIPCKPADASASLFIDGMMLTSSKGEFKSEEFDSLSSNTVWTRIGWDFDFNPDGSLNPRTPVYLKWRASSTWFNDVSGLSETGNEPLPAGSTSRYFQYRTDLFSWDDNPNVAFRPPGKGAYLPCVRYSPMYDGSITPAVKLITVEYQPDAGRFVSRAIAPYRLRRWKQASFQTYDDAANGGKVAIDICDGSMNPIMTNVTSPVSLTHLDPNQYPVLRVRGTCYKNGNGAAVPKVYWFRLEFESMKDCLELDHNSIRLSLGEQAGILFCVDQEGTVEVKVYDDAGQLVKRIFRGEMAAGPAYRQIWDGTDSRGKPVTSGLYFVAVSTPAGRYTRRIAVSR